MPRNTSVTLGSHFDEFISEQINQGRYQSVSDVIRAGLRKIEDNEIKRQKLRSLLEQSESGPKLAPISADNFLSGLHSKHIFTMGRDLP